MTGGQLILGFSDRGSLYPLTLARYGSALVHTAILTVPYRTVPSTVLCVVCERSITNVTVPVCKNVAFPISECARAGFLYANENGQ